MRFTRRQLREALPFGDTQLKVHLARLADYELVTARRTGPGGFSYELAWQPSADSRDAATTPDRSGSEGSRSAPGRGLVGGWSAPGRPAPEAPNGQASGHECVRFFVRGDFLPSGSGCLSGSFSSRYLMCCCPFYPAIPPSRAFRAVPGLMLRVPVIVPHFSFRVPLPCPGGSPGGRSRL